MTDSKEQQIRAQLEESTDFLQRQRLLKALWKLQQHREDEQPKSDRAVRAA
jgi:hypothetical protein